MDSCLTAAGSAPVAAFASAGGAAGSGAAAAGSGAAAAASGAAAAGSEDWGNPAGSGADAAPATVAAVSRTAGCNVTFSRSLLSRPRLRLAELSPISLFCQRRLRRFLLLDLLRSGALRSRALPFCCCHGSSLSPFCHQPPPSPRPRPRPDSSPSPQMQPLSQSLSQPNSIY